MCVGGIFNFYMVCYIISVVKDETLHLLYLPISPLGRQHCKLLNKTTDSVMITFNVMVK